MPSPAQAADETALECVAFVLCDGDKVLVEKRKATKVLLPGVLALPGGHVEKGESLDQALAREAMEELGVTLIAPRHVCALLHRSTTELRRIHYYLVDAWQGTIENNEAESLSWIPANDDSRLDLDIDRVALRACREVGAGRKA